MRAGMTWGVRAGMFCGAGCDGGGSNCSNCTGAGAISAGTVDGGGGGGCCRTVGAAAAGGGGGVGVISTAFGVVIGGVDVPVEDFSSGLGCSLHLVILLSSSSSSSICESKLMR